MEATLRSIAASVPAGALLVGSVVSCFRRKTVASTLQVIGATCLMVAVTAHISEAFHVLPGMGWGEAAGLAYYLDVASGILGVALFPLGYLIGTMG